MSQPEPTDLDLIKVICRRHFKNIVVKECPTYGWQAQFKLNGIPLATSHCKSESRAWAMMLLLVPEFQN